MERQRAALGPGDRRSPARLHGPVPVRRYYPTAGALPAILFFHGGSNVVSDLATHDKVTG